MKKGSSSKTATKTISAPKVEVDANSSVNVRKIQNGFIVSESGSTGKGRNQQYYNKEYYSPNNPLSTVSKGIKIGK